MLVNKIIMEPEKRNYFMHQNVLGTMFRIVPNPYEGAIVNMKKNNQCSE